MAADKFYVSVINGNRKGLLLGPYDSHQEALDLVEPVRRYIAKIDEWSVFYEFGTAGIDSAAWGDKPLPQGKLNSAVDQIKEGG